MYYRYIKGDTNEDGSRYLPFDDTLMEYDYNIHRYKLRLEGIKDVLGINLTGMIKPPYTANVVLEEVRDVIYEYVLDNPNNHANEIVEFKIGRMVNGRNGIYQAMIAQLRYLIRTGKPLDELGNPISPRAMKILRSEMYNRLAFKGSYAYRVNPDSTDDDGYRNGY